MTSPARPRDGHFFGRHDRPFITDDRKRTDVKRLAIGNGGSAKLGRRLRRRGSAAEMVMVLPFLVAIVLACVDFGRFAYNYIAVSNAVRAGAAWATINPPSDMTNPPASWQTSIQQVVSTEMSQQPGFQSGSLTVNTATVTTEAGGTWRFTISASYPFQALVRWNFGWFGTSVGIPSSLTLSKSVTMRGLR
jgi:Flp pilus assembly protein TadG